MSVVEWITCNYFPWYSMSFLIHINPVHAKTSAPAVVTPSKTARSGKKDG